MKIITCDLNDHNFFTYHEIISNVFSNVIPWYDRLIKNVDSPNNLKEIYHVSTGNSLGEIKPLILVDNERVFGGMMHFVNSPEYLGSRDLDFCIDVLNSNPNVTYISLFTLNYILRGMNLGSNIFQACMTHIMPKHGYVWGIVSETKLLNYYLKFGFKVHYSNGNYVIITLQKDDFRNRPLFKFE